jgi:3-hydroxybutyryl-CoA dehydrogenase
MTRIAIVGAGLMGHGIAQVFARAGHMVRVLRSASAQILSTLHARIRRQPGRPGPRRGGGQPGERSRQRLPPRWAAPGSWSKRAPKISPLKRQIFANIEAAAARRRRFSHSNTSVIPITEIMRELKRSQPRRRHPLVEPALSGAAGRGGGHRMVDPRRDRAQNHDLLTDAGKTRCG